MALLGNFSVLNKSAGRQLSGSTISETKSNWQKSGAFRGRYGSFNAKSSSPEGCRPPITWVIPMTSGGLASRGNVVGTGSTYLPGSALAGGLPASATLTGIGTVVGTGLLVVSAIATLTGSGVISNAAGVATLNAIATLTGSGNVSAATLLAKAYVDATLSGTGTLTATEIAMGELAATILVNASTTLSVDDIAAAVWEEPMASHSVPGTFGQRLKNIFPGYWGV